MDTIIQSVLRDTKEMERQMSYYHRNGEYANANRLAVEIENKQRSLCEAHSTQLRILNWHLRDTLKRFEPRVERPAANWKGVTITMPTGNKMSLDDIFLKMEWFTGKKFRQYIYAIEHISTNRHIHIAAQFNRKKWPSQEFRDDLEKQFPKPYDISKFTTYKGKKVDHLASKTDSAIAGWIDYIKKDEEDKQIFDFLSPTFT